MPLFDQIISNPNITGAIGQAAVGAKKKVKGALAGTMFGGAAGIKPEEQAPPAPNAFSPIPTNEGPSSTLPKNMEATPAPPRQPGEVGLGENGVRSVYPSPGIARTSTNGGPTQEWRVPTGPMPMRPENRPAPIGRAHISGEGDTGSGGGGGDMGAIGAHNISSFYSNLGLPLDQVIGGAQHDENMAKSAWAQREGGETATRALQQAGMAQGLASGPQNDLAKRISELSTANLYNPTPEGTALIKHYIQRLQGMSPAAAATGQQQEAPTPAATPTVTNNHPGFGGMAHAAIRGGIAGLGGAAGWAGGAALAPETGGLSLAVPALASLAGYWGAGTLADKIDPGGAEAAQEHPMASMAGQVAGGYGGYKGFGRRATTPPENVSTKNVGANTGGPAGTIGAEAVPNPTPGTTQARQMSPFGGGEVNPGETPIAPRSRQLTMGSMGADASASQNTQTAGTPSPMPSQAAPFAPNQPPNPQATTGYGYDRGAFPTIKAAMGEDPQVMAAIEAFKQQQQSAPQVPQPQETQAGLTPPLGMQSTAMPTPRVGTMRVEQPAERQRVGTNPVQMPQQPSGVTTLNPALLDPRMLQQLIGDPRIGPAITHDPAFQALIHRYINSPAQ